MCALFIAQDLLYLGSLATQLHTVMEKTTVQLNRDYKKQQRNITQH